MRRLIVVLQTDCPTCRLITPYLNALAGDSTPVSGVSQDGEEATREFVRQMDVRFAIERDPGFELSRRLGAVTVPTLFVMDDDTIVRQEPGFDKTALNEIAAMFGHAPLASAHDGAPPSKPGCTSRHLETQINDASADPLNLYSPRGTRASTIDLANDEDPYEYCY